MKKRITWLTNSVDWIGGIERVICNISNYLDEAGYTIKIVSLNTTKGTMPFPLNKNITVEHLGYPLKDNLNRKQLKFAIKAFLENENGKSDIIITCHPWIAMPLLQQRKLYSGKIISTEHSTWDSHSRARRALNLFYYRRTDRLVLLTEHAESIYRKYGLKNTTVIPNFIIDYPSQTAKLEKKELIAAGRLLPVKGYDRLIEAIGLIKDQFASWHLTIYGDGEEHDRLIDLIHQNHVEKLVSIEHFTNQLQKKLQACSGFVLSSHSEAFPMVSLESLSNGVPIITFDIPSLREIDDQSGALIFAEQDNPSDLAIKISNYIQSSDRQKRGVAARKLSETYSIKKVAPQWIDLIESI